MASGTQLARNLATRLWPVGARRQAATINLALSYSKYSVLALTQVILVPFYLRSVSLSEYGAWLASGNVIALLTIVDFGYHLFVTQRLACATRDLRRFSSEAGSAMFLTSAFAMAVSGLIWWLTPRIVAWVNCPASARVALQIAIWTATVGTAERILAFGLWSVLQAWQMALWSEGAFLLGSVTGLCATVVCLRAGMGVAAFGVGEACAGTICLAVVLRKVVMEWARRGLPLPAARAGAVIELAKVAVPVMVSRATTTVANTGQPALISMIIGPGYAAMFSLTSRLYNGCTSFLMPVVVSAFAGLADLGGEGDIQRVREAVRKLCKMCTHLAALMFAICCALNVAFGALWVGAYRFGGDKLSVLLCIAALLMGANAILTILLAALGESAHPAWVGLLEASIRVPLTIALLHAYGVVAIPVAVCVTVGCGTAPYLLFRLSRRLALTYGSAARLVGNAIPHLVACLVVGGVAGVAYHPRTWAALACLALMLGTSFIVAAALFDAGTRRLLKTSLPLVFRRVPVTK